MKPKARRPFLSPPRAHLFFLLVLTLAGCFLSYFHPAFSTGAMTVLFGILLPIFLAGGSFPRTQEGLSGLWTGTKMTMPAWLPVVVVLGGVFVRFYRLVDLSVWPEKDEGICGFDAMEMARHWDLTFFYTVGEVPPFFRILQGVFFKILAPSLFSLWLLPALLSLASFPLGYWASRQFFSRPFSFLTGSLLALGFWPVYLGRFSFGTVWLLLWEFLALGLLGSFFKSNGRREKTIFLAALAVATAGGFYIYAAWAVIALAIGIAILVWSIRQWKARWTFLSLFASLTLFFLIPFAWESAIQGYGRHILEMASLGGGHSFFDRLVLCGSYLSGIFWGVDPKGFCFGPAWGGFLNPVLASFFFLGVIQLFWERSLPFVQWLALAFVLSLLPGFLSHDLQMLRVMMVIPFLLVTTAAGMNAWLASFDVKWRPALLALLLALGGGLDLYHLAVPYAKACSPGGDFFRSSRSEESYNSFQILNRQAASRGPGLLFLDFIPVHLDQSLTLASYLFNAVLNPRLVSSAPTWMAFITNVNYRPFLEKRFPEARWSLLGSQLMPWDGELALGIMPVDPSNQAMVNRWLGAQRSFYGVTSGIIRQKTGESRAEVLRNFSKDHAAIQGDPFLESCFWEINYFNHSADKDFEAARRDLEMVLKQGYPAAHIYNELGGLLFFERKYPEARKAFEKAVQLGGAHTPAAENLRLLEAGHS